MTNIETQFDTHLNADVVYEVKKNGFFDKRDIVTITEENQIIDATEMIPYESGFTCIEGTSGGIAPKTIKLSDYILPSQHYVNPEEKEALLYPIRNDVKQKQEEIQNFTKDSNVKIVDKVAYNFTGTEKITFGEKNNEEKNYVIVGNAKPTTDSIFSGTLDYNNYVAFPFKNNDFNTFEITTSFSFSSLSTYNAILDLNNAALFLGVYQNRLDFYVGSNGSSWNIASQAHGTTTIQTNTRYWVKCGRSESTYYVKLSTDGENFNSEITVNSTTRLAYFDKLSIAYYTADTNWIFNGTYYFSNLTFAADGETPKYLYLYEGKPYTEVGNISVANNIAYNFSSTAYIRVDNLNLDTTRPWQFSTEVTVTSLSSDTRIIGSANAQDTLCGFVLGMSTSGQLLLWLSSTGESWDICNSASSSGTIPLNTPYGINVKYDGSSYIVEAKALTEETFVNFITINDSTTISHTIDFDLGISVRWFLAGAMNLKNTTFYNENEIIWNGKVETPKDINKVDLTGKFVVFNPAHGTSSIVATSTTHNLCYNYFSTQQFAAYNLSNGTRYVGKTFIKPGKKYWYKGVWENQKYTLYSMEDNGDFTLETLPDVDVSGVHKWENPRFRTSATLTLDDITYTIKASHSSEASPHYKYTAFNYDLTTADGGWWTNHGDTSTTPCWISLHSTTPVCPTEIILMSEISTPATPKNVEIRGIYSDGTYIVLKSIVVKSNIESLLTTISIDTDTFFNEIQIYCSSSYSTSGVSLQQIFIKGKINSKYWTKELEFDCEECPIDIYKTILGNNPTGGNPLQGFIYLADTKLTYNNESITPYQKIDEQYTEDKYTIKKYQEKEHVQTLTNLNYKADEYWYQYLPNVFENTTQKAEMGFSFTPRTASNFTMNSGILQLYDSPLSNSYSSSGTVNVNATTKIATFTSGSFIYPSGVFFNVSDRISWELKLKIKHTTPNTLQEFYRSSESGSYKGLILAISEENKLKIWANNDENVASWNLADGISGEFEVPTDTWIWLRMYFDGTKYALTYSLDDITYTEDITFYSYRRLSYYGQVCRIGSGQNSYFRGEIDLKGVKIPTSVHSYWYPIVKGQINANSNAFRVWTTGGNINIQLKLNNTNIIDITRAIFNGEKTYIKLCYDKTLSTPWSIYMGYSFDEMTKIGSSSNTNTFTTASGKLCAQFGHDYIVGYTGMNGEINITDFYLKENDTTIKLNTKATDIADVGFIGGTGWAYIKDNYNTIQLTSGCILNNQNILSNFDTHRYARIPDPLNFGACDYEIVFKYKFNDFANDYNCLFGVFEDVDFRMPKIQYYKPENSIKLYIENTDGTAWQSGTGINIPGLEVIKNSWLYIMVKREGAVYYLKTSGDNTNWVTRYIFQYKSIPYSNTYYHMALGTCCVSTTSHEWFSGEIDLNESYIKIGDNIAWKYRFNTEEITETTMPGLLTENMGEEPIVTLNAYSCIDNDNKIYTILAKTEPDASLYKQVILIKENVEIQKDELTYIYNKEKEQFDIEGYREVNVNVVPSYATVQFEEVIDEN